MGSVSVPPAGVPVAMAMLVSSPLAAVGEPLASSSAWVTVCEALQVVSTRRGPAWSATQTGSASTLSSLTLRALMVTLPVLVSR